MKVKTSELTGVALDWAVARAEEGEELAEGWHPHTWERGGQPELRAVPYTPSTNWSQGGPIIEREKLCIGFQHQLDNVYVPTIDPDVICWARTTAGGYLKYGPTPLIAAMRCFCCSKLGDVVDIPEELCQQQNS